MPLRLPLRDAPTPERRLGQATAGWAVLIPVVLVGLASLVPTAEANFTSQTTNRSNAFAAAASFGAAAVSVNSTGDAVDDNIGDGDCDTGSTTTGGSAECTLRAAIAEANASAAIGTVNFSIPSADTGYASGVWTITPATPLPSITSALTIDAATQTGHTANTAAAPAALNNTLVVELDGSTASGNGLALSSGSDSSVVRGLAVVNFTSGIRITDSSGVKIVGNYIGLSVDGTTPRPNVDGVVLASDSNGNSIGAVTAADRNVISGNQTAGIQLSQGATNSNSILGNLIGTDRLGAAAVGNGSGVRISSGAMTLGGAAAGSTNVVAGNGTGVLVKETNTNQTTIQGNYIGAGSDGTSLPNTSDGIYLDAGSNILIGGTGSDEGNIISNNGGAGIAVLRSISAFPSDVSILGNSISQNTALGIDLSDSTARDGVTANDSGDSDAGPNDLLNYPAINIVRGISGSLTVSYSLDVPAGSYRVEFFTNPDGIDSTGYGEGQVFAGYQDITSGGFSYTASISGYPGDDVSATITEITGTGTYGPTSEFSLSRTAVFGS